MIRDDVSRDSDVAASALEVDPDRSSIIVAIGTKGSGKSQALREIFDAWPHDRYVIDVTGDARPDDPHTVPITVPMPAALPQPPEGQRRTTAWVRISPKSPNFTGEQDDALALGLYPRHRNVLVWVDEYAMMATATKIEPNLRLALASSRHYHLSMLLAFPRPVFVPRITLAQADKVFIFRTPDVDDREVIAKNIGVPVREFDPVYRETMARDPHAFLLWDSRLRALVSCPPLPLRGTHGPRA